MIIIAKFIVQIIQWFILNSSFIGSNHCLYKGLKSSPIVRPELTIPPATGSRVIHSIWHAPCPAPPSTRWEARWSPLAWVSWVGKAVASMSSTVCKVHGLLHHPTARLVGLPHGPLVTLGEVLRITSPFPLLTLIDLILPHLVMTHLILAHLRMIDLRLVHLATLIINTLRWGCREVLRRRCRTQSRVGLTKRATSPSMRRVDVGQGSVLTLVLTLYWDSDEVCGARLNILLHPSTI